jgi:hypothetical protein
MSQTPAGPHCSVGPGDGNEGAVGNAADFAACRTGRVRFQARARVFGLLVSRDRVLLLHDCVDCSDVGFAFSVLDEYWGSRLNVAGPIPFCSISAIGGQWPVGTISSISPKPETPSL